jgi:hypothetical protein
LFSACVRPSLAFQDDGIDHMEELFGPNSDEECELDTSSGGGGAPSDIAAPLDGGTQVVTELPVPAEKKFRHPSWPVPGGHIVFSGEGTMDAHCSCEAHKCTTNPCRLNRTAEGTGSVCRGRPLGFLLAWLQLHSKATRQNHSDAGQPKKMTAEDRVALGREIRQRWRMWLNSRPEYRTLVDRERPKGGGEPDEPHMAFD